MLILSRKVNEQIRIGADITVTVTKIKGGTVRLAISAPQDLRIVREENRNAPKAA